MLLFKYSTAFATLFEIVLLHTKQHLQTGIQSDLFLMHSAANVG